MIYFFFHIKMDNFRQNTITRNVKRMLTVYKPENAKIIIFF